MLKRKLLPFFTFLFVSMTTIGVFADIAWEPATPIKNSVKDERTFPVLLYGAGIVIIIAIAFLIMKVIKNKTPSNKG